MLRGTLRFVATTVAVVIPAYITAVDWLGDIARVSEENDVKDVVLLEKFSVKVQHRFVRGDLVIMHTPDDKPTLTLRRIIGIEGDVVQTRPSAQYKYVKIPRGHCWVEGDHWETSRDSNEFGPLPLALIEGRVAAVLWPPQRMKWLSPKDTSDRSFV